MDEKYAAAIAYASAEGHRAGTNAADWYVQDTLGGRSSLVGIALRDAAHDIARGIADGDPAVLDTFPAPDLSGQWADTLTGPNLVADALRAATGWKMGDDTADYDAWYADVCDAYETTYSDAVQDTIAAAVRLVLA